MKQQYMVKSRFGNEPHEDMLRYDAVELLGKTKDGWFVVGSDRPMAGCTTARWNSFGFDVDDRVREYVKTEER